MTCGGIMGLVRHDRTSSMIPLVQAVDREDYLSDRIMEEIRNGFCKRCCAPYLETLPIYWTVTVVGNMVIWWHTLRCTFNSRRKNNR